MQNFNSNNEDWAEPLLNKLTPIIMDHPFEVRPSSIPNNRDEQYFTRPFSLRELEIAFKRSKNTSPGMDQILYPMLLNLSKLKKNHLLSILNDAWEQNVEIPDFKNVIVHPILKSCKDPNDADSYRPISLLSSIYKTLERMIKFRLEHWLENKKLIPDSQFGF